MSMLVFGDSHCVFLSRYLGKLAKGTWVKQHEAPLPIIDGNGVLRAELVLVNPNNQVFTTDCTPLGDRVAISPAFKQHLDRYNSSSAYCIVSLHGNDHTTQFTYRHTEPFDFICTKVPYQLEFGRTIIPRKVIIRQFQGTRILLNAKLAAIRSLLPNARIVFLLPPPPISDLNHIHSNPGAFNFQQFPLENKWVRLKIYYAFCDVLSDTCRTLGIPRLEAPPTALDSDGFLAAPYWQVATHAAPAYYGLLMAHYDMENL